MATTDSVNPDNSVSGTSVLPIAERVTAITVNYKTFALTQSCIESFRKFYPDVHHILVDNYSRDDSTTLIQSYTNVEHYTVILNTSNIGHGPAMVQAIALVTTPFFFTLDSDCEMTTPGLLEAMLERMDADDNLYAVGWLRYVDRCSGVPHSWHVHPPPLGEQFIPYVHPCAGLYRMSMYRQLPPFQHHGAPCLDNMCKARDKGFSTEDFAIAKYLKHLEAGTRRMFGGYWAPSDDTVPDKWDENKRFPI